jgi:ribosomal protein S18 acetylase RimI-like enzyme
MWVDGRFRGTEVASRLVAHVVDATPGERLVLHVLPTNARAQALYRKAGFVDDGTDVIEGRPLLRMRHTG